ncbi:hypothetical protein [Halostagnicola sp. A-GB9-2]|uniref:hypothetical protein n=1 Tax=Halostagnicola sp. A-GB9-2 TaxID=3048066 RepID=UPI0024C08CD9|nr:hypothetical protein [Halostagnicola sp. A-GB9-2]MDJ1434288.1 hypothetical protein [Halostagnicola sp. A-GB9-2]
MVRQAVLTGLREHGEKIALLVYLGIVVAVTPVLAQLYATAWTESHILRSVMELREFVGIGQGVINFLFLGFVIGLLALMTLDPKKRWQALLIWIGLGVTLFFLASSGTFVPDVSQPEDAIAILPGLVLGLLLGGGRKALELKQMGPIEYRRATWSIYALLVGVVFVSLIEAHIVYPEFIEVSEQGVTILSPESSGLSLRADGLAVNVLASGVAVGTARRFTQYESNDSFFVLGPPASGKSLLLIGAYLKALERDEDKRQSQREALNPSQDLMELVENLDRDATDWIVEATGRSELQHLEFKFVKGTLFPKNVTVSSVDYAGEHLSRIPDALEGNISNPDAELEALTEGIRDANKLILLIDLERFVNNEGLGLAEYFSILEVAEDTGVVLVPTKADILADQYWEATEQDPQDSFDDFKQFVEDELSQSQQFSSLLRQTPELEVHPVYYETTLNEEDERVPARDDRGSVITVGFGRLLQRLGG